MLCCQQLLGLEALKSRHCQPPPPPRQILVIVRVIYHDRNGAKRALKTHVNLETFGHNTVRQVLQQIEALAAKATGLRSMASALYYKGLRVHDSGQQIDYYCPGKGLECFQAVVLARLADAPEVFIQTLTGKTLISEYRATMKVEDLKSFIQTAEGIPVNQQRLIVEGTQLEDGRLLTDCNIKAGDKLHLVLRLRGGGGPELCGVAPFSDISDTTAVQKQAFQTTDVKPWRVAKPGLCVEGHCENLRCQAHGHLVIDNKGYTHFDLMLSTSRCPCCEGRIEPLTCAFNNCEWRYTGVKLQDPNKPSSSQLVESDSWTHVGHEYLRFTSAYSKQVAWQRLLVVAREPHQSAATAANGKSKPATGC